MRLMRIIPLAMVELIARLAGYIVGIYKPRLAYAAERAVRGRYWAQSFGTRKIRVGRGVNFEGRDGIELGSEVNIGSGTLLITGPKGHIKLGTKSHISRMTVLSGGGNITIGERCMISSLVAIYSVQNSLGSDRPALEPPERLPVAIGNDVFVGVGAKILPGVTIGDNAIIGAGAVVNKNVPKGTTVVGVPAKPV